MKRLAIGLLVVGLLVGCSPLGVAIPLMGNNPVIVPATIMAGGASVEVSEIKITNFHAGARVEVVYSVYNESNVPVSVEFFPIFSDNVREGYRKAPEYIKDWLEFPEDSLIQPNEAKQLLVSLVMPEDGKILFDKWEFQLGIAGKVQGRLQPAVAVRWLVDMK